MIAYAVAATVYLTLVPILPPLAVLAFGAAIVAYAYQVATR